MPEAAADSPEQLLETLLRLAFGQGAAGARACAVGPRRAPVPLGRGERPCAHGQGATAVRPVRGQGATAAVIAST